MQEFRFMQTEPRNFMNACQIQLEYIQQSMILEPSAERSREDQVPACVASTPTA
jgi:hypothetical protein